ncbi:MAG: hypothetical protein HY726_11275 [Candidatus Rokubacteria bacterium]|nr:hypothetical protein [Candidatus Rokubacteria bacterium]
MRARWWVLGAIAGVLLFHGFARAAEPVAVLTEIRKGQGDVGVKPAGAGDWVAPQPLLALRPGDQIRATQDARAVLLFTGGRGTQVISAANSPFTVQAPAGESGTEKVRAVVASVTQFLLGQQKQLTYQSLSVRSLSQPPLIIAPRDTHLIPGPVAFEWAGSDRLRYSVRVLGPEGLVWEQANLQRRPVDYPASAPALRPGVRYRWELTAPGHPVQRAQFEVLSAAEGARVRAALALLEPAGLGYSRGTVALIRAGLLFQEGLYHDARRELLAGVVADPEEPTLHLLLGSVYERIGLKELAAREFEEAQFLSTRRP